MSWNSVITVTDEHDSHAIYVHDGPPDHVLTSVEVALAFAWPLPRFEADDFAAALVRVMKKGGGGVALSTGLERHAGLAWHYYMSQDSANESRLRITEQEPVLLKDFQGKIELCGWRINAEHYLP